MRAVRELEYVGRCPECGRVVAWHSLHDTRAGLAAAVAKWIKDGLSVERMTAEAVGENFTHADGCPRDWVFDGDGEAE